MSLRAKTSATVITIRKIRSSQAQVCYNCKALHTTSVRIRRIASIPWLQRFRNALRWYLLVGFTLRTRPAFLHVLDRITSTTHWHCMRDHRKHSRAANDLQLCPTPNCLCDIPVVNRSVCTTNSTLRNTFIQIDTSTIRQDLAPLAELLNRTLTQQHSNVLWKG